jgi:hypothetical protein
VSDVANNPPLKWTHATRRKYVQMAGAVVAATGIGSLSPELAATFDWAYLNAMHTINTQEEACR